MQILILQPLNQNYLFSPHSSQTPTYFRPTEPTYFTTSSASYIHSSSPSYYHPSYFQSSHSTYLIPPNPSHLSHPHPCHLSAPHPSYLSSVQNAGAGGTDARNQGDGTSDEPAANLQHISEREPDDLDQDPSLHPTAGPLFLSKSRQIIESMLCIFFLFLCF